MKFLGVTVSLILVGINLLALGFGRQPFTIDLRSCLAAFCVNSYLLLFFFSWVTHRSRKFSETGLLGAL